MASCRVGYFYVTGTNPVDDEKKIMGIDPGRACFNIVII